MSTSRVRSESDRDDRRFGESYARLVRSLPQVQRVLLERTMVGPRIWTIITAEPFQESPREAVYQAELQAMEQSAAVVMDFRLVNLCEFAPESHDSLLPAAADVLFQR